MAGWKPDGRGNIYAQTLRPNHSLWDRAFQSTPSHSLWNRRSATLWESELLRRRSYHDSPPSRSRVYVNSSQPEDNWGIPLHRAPIFHVFVGDFRSPVTQMHVTCFCSETRLDSSIPFIVDRSDRVFHLRQ